ncbi:MAG: hypothetical protein KGY76_05805 [Candidatus Thermoplasmatota archaeon]|nr:hypothetical protein [Candidatus Thermoplasmatota archaeon]
MVGKDESKKRFLKKISEKVDESTFESPFFNKELNNSYGHFSSVIKEIKDGKSGNSHLIKIRPPLFYLNGILSNFSRLLSGTSSRKILDNDRWRHREKEYLKSLNPDLEISHTGRENAISMEKIDGEVPFDLLQNPDIDENEKIKTILKLGEGLADIHEKDLYHGEPNTQNCIVTRSGEVYWIDFEIEYHQDLDLIEKKANDLEQLILSVMGAFEEEGEIGLDDEELIELILESYEDEDIISQFLNNTNVPLIGPYRMIQLSFTSAYRFYQAQINLLRYINDWEIEF